MIPLIRFETLGAALAVALAFTVAAVPAAFAGKEHDSHFQAVGAGGLFVIAAHGHYAVVLESNGNTEGGIVSGGPLEAGETGIQVHDICYGLFDEADVGAWQDAHEFDYVPWQTGEYGLEEEGPEWLDVWLAKGIDLVALEEAGVDLAEACANLGGAFEGPDTTLAGPVDSGDDHDDE